MVTSKGRQFHETRYLGVRNLHDGVGIGGVISCLFLFFLHQAYHLIDTPILDERVDIVFQDNHRLQVRKHLFVKVLLHVGTVEGLHLIGLI
ncbi:hypothetical protein SDC9_198089 [bioreactor metagenome]|uniref:Uncharacterized protein n=1 Tax=bioreactor metagenome TaxID=1076179 RepID=A0A645II01_9ZZZZ